jgi:hypothetical protein
MRIRSVRYCLGFLSYKGYSHTDHRRHQIHSTFSLNEYFTAYPKSLISALPLHSDATAPLNVYGAGFREASAFYREEQSWTCGNEKCGVDLSERSHHKYLHTHHVNARKYDDRRENHKALCIRCHAEEPMHAHLKNSPDYQAFIRIYPHLLQVARRHRTILVGTGQL